METYTPFLIANALTLLFLGGFYLMSKHGGLIATAGSIIVVFVLLCTLSDQHWIGAWTTAFIPKSAVTPLWANLLSIWFVSSAYFAIRYDGIARKGGIFGMVVSGLIIVGEFYFEGWPTA